MDSVTQVVLGSAIGAAIAHKQLGRSALIIGGVLGTLPDLDVFMPAADAIESFTEHRSFSHSLFVLFPFAFICFAVLKLKFKSDMIANQRLFWLCCLTLITHPILDAFTSYGTQLFWPLAIHPISIASIFVIDPLYTVPLLVGCVYLWRGTDKTKARRVNHIGLVLSSGYLLLSVLIQTQMLNKVELALQSKGIATDKVFISPLYPSLNWWIAIVIDDGAYYDVKLNALTNSLVLSEKQDLGLGVVKVTTPDLALLDWFTDGFIRLEDVDGRLVATDLRMKTGTVDYAFKFALAEKDADGWKEISSLRL
ncbi:metal-dependent hydrolase [Moritella sp. 24]|uniref:metal-dependent hydrolase n=1 Tax=Moritella sp. 24 TaxID=2746230 RepID=UPI001BAB8431|nr:metal-dependent hydrolase [Moritella sp. 24]QUM76697.1 metal-dependent hydrolase [Moritella sp. 24]